VTVHFMGLDRVLAPNTSLTCRPWVPAMVAIASEPAPSKTVSLDPSDSRRTSEA